jgi:hypothetical protein
MRRTNVIILVILALVVGLSAHNLRWPGGGGSRVGAVLDVRASATAVPPMKVGRDCLEVDEANRLSKASPLLDRVKCEDDAAIGSTQKVRRASLFVKRGGVWFYYKSRTNWSGTDACDDMPSVIRSRLVGCDK